MTSKPVVANCSRKSRLSFVAVARSRRRRCAFADYPRQRRHRSASPTELTPTGSRRRSMLPSFAIAFRLPVELFMASQLLFAPQVLCASQARRSRIRGRFDRIDRGRGELRAWSRRRTYHSLITLGLAKEIEWCSASTFRLGLRFVGSAVSPFRRISCLRISPTNIRVRSQRT